MAAEDPDSDALSVDKTSLQVRGMAFCCRLCSLILLRTISNTASLCSPHSGKSTLLSVTSLSTNSLTCDAPV